MDQMGEVDYAPGEPKGTPWHPHRGFETVTYIIDGIFDHQDSNGGGGTITDGDTQWMTAGSRAAAHRGPAGAPGHVRAASSTASSCGSTCPGQPRWSPPRYQDIRGRPGDAAHLARRRRAAARHRRGRGRPRRPGTTHTPITLAHATLAPGRVGDAAVARGLQRPGVRARPGAAASAPSQRPLRARPARGVRRRGLGDHHAPTTRRTRTPRTSRSSSWAGSRSASRSRTTARS